MKTPAAIARMDRITAKPPSGMNADNPVRMSQMANNRNPKFLVIFIMLSFLSV